MGRKGVVMKALKIIGIIWALCLGVFAQQSVTVSGRISAGLGRTPVQATVIIKQNGQEIRRTTSDAAGAYRFDGVPAGEYKIVAEFGLKTGTMNTLEKALVVNENSHVVVDFDLGAFISQLYSIPNPETVTVSAGESQSVEQVSKTVNVIDAQEMRDRADFSLAETVREIPGFRVQQSGGFGRLATIKTRGLRNQDTAVLIDGIRFRDPTAITGDASPFLGDFTLTSVSKIEVLRGSGSSLYGTNAIGGVLDFQTPIPQRGTHGQIGGAFGGLGLGRFRGNISHGTENDKFGVSAGFSRTVYTKGIDGQDNAYNTNFQPRFEFNPRSGTNISVRFFLSDARVRLNTSPDTAGTLPPSTSTIINAEPNVNFLPDQNDPDSIQRSRFFSAQVAVNHVVNSKLVLSGYYQGLKTKRTNDDGPLGPGFQSAFTSIFDGTIQTVNGHLNWKPVEQNELTAGYEYESEKFGNKGTTPSGTDDFTLNARQASNTFYVQDMVSLLHGRLQFAGGFRAQTFSLERPICSGTCPAVHNNTASPPTAYTGDGSVSYYLERSATKFRAHVGNGYRVPSLYERFGSFFFFGAFSPLGNPALKPERSTAFDVGIEQGLATGRVKLSGTVFYTRINDEITYLPTDDFSAPSYYNFDKHFSRGAEFSVKAQPTSSTDLFASYTFTNSDVRNFHRPFPVGPVFSSDRKAYGIPDHQFTFVATQRYKKMWVNFDFLATSTYLAPVFSNSTFNTYTYRFNGNRKGDLTGGYTIGFKNETRTLRIYGTIENVFNQEYYENGFRTAKLSPRIGMTFGF